MPPRVLHDHPVVPGADDRSYQSVRIRPISRAERFALGRELRQQVPRTSLGQWQPAKQRPDPIAQIVHSHNGRLASLIPIRVSRMVASPYGFLRGATVVMTHDFSRLQATGITPVICGDAHLGNFGFYASPERSLVIDLNDFDEAHPGPWEWDLRRLVTSIWVAGRQNGASEAHCQLSVTSCVAAYRKAVRVLAREPLLARSYQLLDVNLLKRQVSAKSLRLEVTRAVRRARSRTSDRALPRFATGRRGDRRIVD